MKTPLISDSYLALQQQLHLNPSYGMASTIYAPIVAELINSYQFKTLSDYGAGKKRLLESLTSLGIQVQQYFPYDPAFPEYGDPRPGELVCCIDVLEHIEIENIHHVLDNISSMALDKGFLTIHTHSAKKILDDGRNAHIIQAPSSWWLRKLCKYFEIEKLESQEFGFWVIVSRRDRRISINSRI